MTGVRAGDPQEVTLGVDVGGTKVLGVALDVQGRVLADARTSTPSLRRNATPGPGDRVGDPSDSVIDAIVEVASRLGDDAGGAAALGVGVPGLVDDSGTMHFAPNLPAGAGVDFKTRLARAVHARTGRAMRIVVDNDATCATVAEWTIGAATGATDAVGVTLGTGIGAGIVSAGALVRGHNGYAGEAGHMVVDPSGPLCSCGRRGCWERYASGSGLARLAREAASAGRLDAVIAMAGGDEESVRGEHVTAAAASGDRGALEVMAELGRWTALGIANLVTLLDPSVVVIGGGLARAGELLLDPTRSAYADVMYAVDERPAVAIVAAELGEIAGAVGAAFLARGAQRASHEAL